MSKRTRWILIAAVALLLLALLGRGLLAHDDVPLAGMSPAQWRGVLDVSLNGFFNVVQPLLLPMLGYAIALLRDPVPFPKAELMAIPLWGRAAERYGAIPVQRDDGASALRSMVIAARGFAAQGRSLVIFPEGTRSTTGEMKAFNAAGIKQLLKKSPSALVIPIYIHQTWALNRFGKYPMSVGEQISWTVLPAIDPQGKNITEVVVLVEESIRRAYEVKRGA